MNAEQTGPASLTSQFLYYSAGFAGIFGLVTAIGAATGEQFQIAASGSRDGIPLPHRWPYVGLFALIAAALYLASRRWDARGFVGFRARFPWLVPLVVTVVIAPATLVLLFVLVS